MEGRSGGDPEDDVGRNGAAGSSELTLVWDRTGVPGGSEISFFFLEPHRTSGSAAPPGGCSRFPSCGRCLADLSCAWCPPRSACVARGAPRGEGMCGGARGGPRLVLRPAECPACEEKVECGACAADPFCEWQPSSRPGDFVCSRRGRLEGAVRDPQKCPELCSRRGSCAQCVSEGPCAWCRSSGRCFAFGTYLSRFSSGGCQGWHDSVAPQSEAQCPRCDAAPSCESCVSRGAPCGWCWDALRAHIGRCVPGDFSAPWGFPDCGAVLPGSRDAMWAYTECPRHDCSPAPSVSSDQSETSASYPSHAPSGSDYFNGSHAPTRTGAYNGSPAPTGSEDYYVSPAPTGSNAYDGSPAPTGSDSYKGSHAPTGSSAYHGSPAPTPEAA